MPSSSCHGWRSKPGIGLLICASTKIKRQANQQDRCEQSACVGLQDTRVTASRHGQCSAGVEKCHNSASSSVGPRIILPLVNSSEGFAQDEIHNGCELILEKRRCPGGPRDSVQ
eukprot:5225088-Amphidinium_carterae.1